MQKKGYTYKPILVWVCCKVKALSVNFRWNNGHFIGINLEDSQPENCRVYLHDELSLPF